MTRQAEPAVSVVIPAYNAAWCVGRAIDSVLTQDFDDRELIVVNDGSTDATADVLRAFGERLRIVDKLNGGLSSARNAGIQVARGRYVAFLDADDAWLPGKLTRQMVLMASRPELSFCSTAARIEGPAGEVLGDWRCRCDNRPALEAIFAANAHIAGSGSTVLARRDALQRAGGFDESLRSLEDIDMWMRLASLGDYACIDESLAIILKRPDSMSRNLMVMRNSAIAVMCKNRNLLPPKLRGEFWRSAYACMLSDYAKWAWRAGLRTQAVGDVLTGLRLAPFSQSRLMISLLLAMLMNRPI